MELIGAIGAHEQDPRIARVADEEAQEVLVDASAQWRSSSTSTRHRSSASRRNRPRMISNIRAWATPASVRGELRRARSAAGGARSGSRLDSSARPGPRISSSRSAGNVRAGAQRANERRVGQAAVAERQAVADQHLRAGSARRGHELGGEPRLADARVPPPRGGSTAGRPRRATARAAAGSAQPHVRRRSGWSCGAWPRSYPRSASSSTGPKAQAATTVLGAGCDADRSTIGSRARSAR